MWEWDAAGSKKKKTKQELFGELWDWSCFLDTPGLVLRLAEDPNPISLCLQGIPALLIR